MVETKQGGPVQGGGSTTDHATGLVRRARPEGGTDFTDFVTTGQGIYELDMQVSKNWKPEVLDFKMPNKVAITIERDKMFPQSLNESGYPLKVVRFTDTGFIIDDQRCSGIPYTVTWARGSMNSDPDALVDMVSLSIVIELSESDFKRLAIDNRATTGGRSISWPPTSDTRAAAMRAWNETIGRILICDATEGIQSGVNFSFSEHPALTIGIGNGLATGTPCEPNIVLYSSTSGQHRAKGFWFDIPVLEDKSAIIRLALNAADLRALFPDGLPRRRAFMDLTYKAIELGIQHVVVDRTAPVTVNILDFGKSWWDSNFAELAAAVWHHIVLKSDFGGGVLTYDAQPSTNKYPSGGGIGFLWLTR